MQAYDIITANNSLVKHHSHRLLTGQMQCHLLLVITLQ